MDDIPTGARRGKRVALAGAGHRLTALETQRRDGWMFLLARIACFLAIAVALPVAAHAQIALVTKVLKETRVTAPDGTVKTVLAPIASVVPGDTVVYQITYTNNGKAEARKLVVSNPVPASLVYAGAALGSPTPELSVDGVRFGTLSQLSAKGPDGSSHAATPSDVRIVRWRIDTVGVGERGTVSFRATLK